MEIRSLFVYNKFYKNRFLQFTAISGLVILLTWFYVNHDNFRIHIDTSAPTLKQLKKQQQQQEQQEQQECKSSGRLLATEDYVKFLNVNDINSHHSFHAQISKVELQTTLNLFWYFLDLCENNGIKAVMYGATLLGSYRHHGVVPWDDDIDVLIDVKHKALLSNVMNKDKNVILKTIGRWKVWNKTNSFKTNKIWRWPFIDISFYSVRGDTVYDTLQAFGIVYKFPKSLMFPLHRRPFMGKWLLAPRDTLRFLGYDKTPSDKCISLTYSHKYESGPKTKVMSMKCEKLKDDYPFVMRMEVNRNHSRNDNGHGHDAGIREVLRFRNRTLSAVTVCEPSDAFNRNFTTLPAK